MCNHYRLRPDLIPTWREYIAHDLRMPNAEVKADVWPKFPALVVRRDEAGTFADAMAWGVPTSVKGKNGAMLEKRVTNCRNVASPFWRSMLATPEQRCLVPFTEFAEPKIGEGRAEWWFSLPEQPVAAFAGIWRRIDGAAHFAFLTTVPNSLVEPLHPKAMPVILAPADYEVWLTGDREAACSLIRPYSAEEMVVA